MLGYEQPRHEQDSQLAEEYSVTQRFGSSSCDHNNGGRIEFMRNSQQ